ncbi:hypothetical protein ACHAWC_006411 [Mediolabrus comicus]
MNTNTPPSPLLGHRQSVKAKRPLTPTPTNTYKSLYTILALVIIIGPLLFIKNQQQAYYYYLTVKETTLRGSAASTININITHSDESSASVLKRTTPLDPAEKFSFVHISKCAGSTWIRIFMDALKLNICPRAEAGPEHSVAYQKNYACKDADYTLTSLRSPRHHVWSQFTMCKYSDWGMRHTANTSFPRTGDGYKDDELDFDSWLGHFTEGNQSTYYKCYHPANFQSRALTSETRYVASGRGGFNPNVTLAMDTYNNLDFVALVEFTHESQCMLYHRLGNTAPAAAISYLSNSCHCEEAKKTTDNQNGTIHVVHHNKGKRSILRNLPPATLSKAEYLTSADVQIYRTALRNFIGEMAWLESDASLGRRVLCPDVLERWEPELAYLDGKGTFNVTQLYQDAVMKQ